MTPLLQLQQLTFFYPGQPKATVDHLDLAVMAQECLVLLGASGCGKSTVLRLMAGLERPSAGQVVLQGQVVRGPGKGRGMVFQDYSLFPWLSVWKNVCFPWRLRAARDGSSRQEHRARAEELLHFMGLWAFRQHNVGALSGGMRQRVAIARALMARPKVLLLDEPFAALDVQTRLRMQDLLLQLMAHEHLTVVFVTHDVDEALRLADRIVVLAPGAVVEREYPLEACDGPAVSADQQKSGILASIQATIQAPETTRNLG